MKRLLAVAVAVVAVLALSGVASAATNPRVFNSVPDQLPHNVSSYGPEAYAFRQLGDAIQLAPGKRVLKNVTVTMSDWACETGSWDVGGSCVTTSGATFAQAVTMKLYGLNPDGSVGNVLATRSQTFNIKFRPTSNCPTDDTAWLASDGNCYHGLAQNITFKFATQNVTLPNRFVYGISYNTRTAGPNPTGVSGPADSLNIGAAAGAPKRGTDLHLGGFYVDATAGGLGALDSPCVGSGTPNVFSLDDGCQTGLNPLVRFVVKK